MSSVVSTDLTVKIDEILTSNQLDVKNSENINVKFAWAGILPGHNINSVAG